MWPSRSTHKIGRRVHTCLHLGGLPLYLASIVEKLGKFLRLLLPCRILGRQRHKQQQDGGILDQLAPLLDVCQGPFKYFLYPP